MKIGGNPILPVLHHKMEPWGPPRGFEQLERKVIIFREIGSPYNYYEGVQEQALIYLFVCIWEGGSRRREWIWGALSEFYSFRLVIHDFRLPFPLATASISGSILARDRKSFLNNLGSLLEYFRELGRNCLTVGVLGAVAK